MSNHILPHATDVERAVLGSMFIDADSRDQALELLSPKAFYSQQNELVFRCFVAIAKTGSTVDISTMSEELKCNGWFDKIGAEPYLATLLEDVATSTNIEHHATIISQKHVLRQLAMKSRETYQLCLSQGADAKKILDYAEASVSEISTAADRTTLYTLGEILATIGEGIGEEGASPVVGGIETGFERLDSMTTGLHSGEMTIIAGRPGMGKTAFGLRVAMNITKANENSVVVFFSLEMPRNQLGQRAVAMDAFIEMATIRRNSLSIDDVEKFRRSSARIGGCHIIVDDSTGLDQLKMRSRMRRVLREYGRIDLVIVDYLQLMHGVGKFENRQGEIAGISAALKATAKDFDTHIMALSQLSRAVESRVKDKRPMLSDLRESGAIEQDADVVLMLYRDEVYNSKTDDKDVAELIVTKQRNGPLGTIRLAFVGKYVRYDNLSFRRAEDDAGEF